MARVIKDRVQVLISDTGPGFSNPDRVFDPFFTTKKPGEGPGLGLTLCYSIVREHGGDISAFNLQPHGAAVAIELPVIEAADEVAAAREVFTRVRILSSFRGTSPASKAQLISRRELRAGLVLPPNAVL